MHRLHHALGLEPGEQAFDGPGEVRDPGKVLVARIGQVEQIEPGDRVRDAFSRHVFRKQGLHERGQLGLRILGPAADIVGETFSPGRWQGRDIEARHGKEIDAFRAADAGFAQDVPLMAA